MKPGIPWSVKGIEPEAREAAKLAARRAGLTLGEWLNSVIFDQSEHILPRQSDSHAWDRYVTSSSTPPEPPRAAPAASRDDSGSRLQDIAQQLADLAQRERHTVPSPALSRGRPVEHDEVERIVARLEENERQTVEALSAVNERLSVLGHNIAQLSRPNAFERPEDVPGYPALESAIRSVVEHIEVSERRTRDSLKSMQERLAELAEQKVGAPTSEDVLRAVPILSSLESRLADMVSRIQRSEGLMSERIEGVRVTAQQMANQAQASAVTAVRGELREVETRMLASLKEAQAAAANAPSVVATEIAKLHGDVAALVRRLDEVKAGAASDRDLQSLRGAIEQLSARVAQVPDMRPLADMDKRLGDINRRLEQAASASREEPRAGALEQRIAELDHRLAEAIRLQGDQRALGQLEDSILAVNQRVAQAEQQLGHLETMEQAIRQLYDSLEQMRGSLGEVAAAAASRVVEASVPPPAAAAVASPELAALEDGLNAIRESAATAERRHQETFEAVHETLAEIVEKLAQLETGGPLPAATAAAAAAVVAAAREEPAPRERPTAMAEGFAHPPEPLVEAPSASPVQEPLSAGDDFIAAARRAAQAASSRPSALRAEFAAMTPAAPEPRPARPSLLQRLRGGRAEPAGSDAAERDAASGSGRRTLIIAGLMLLMAASVFAYRSISGASAPAVQQSENSTVVPKQPLVPSEAADLVVTGSLPPDVMSKVVAQPLAAPLDMPPPEAGPKALRKAAADGDARAQFVIAGRYLDAQGVEQDFAKALNWYQQAAARGLAPAQYRLATLYELGKGTAVDPHQALNWYERAALGGNVRAMHNAAVLLAGDKAGKPDFDRAFRWFKAAAERGFADSQFNLAILYERGLGTAASNEQAYVWYSLAAKQGDQASLQRAATLAKDLPAAGLAAAKARLASWSPTPSDDSANVVTIVEPAWKDPGPAATTGGSS